MRRRITALVAATTSVVLLAFLVPAGYLVSRVARTTAESRAQTQLQSLTALVVGGGTAGAQPGLDSARREGFYAWITVGGVTTVGTDPAAGRLDGGDRSEVRAVDATGATPGGTLFVQPVVRDGVSAVIRVLAPDSELRAGVARIWTILGGLGLLLFLAALVVADRLARSLSRPVTELAATAARLEDGDLAARVDPAGPPEVQDVGVALNRLARRIVELLAAEREAVADLSHRLRTPVTALRLDAGALTDPEERARLAGDVDELDRAVDAVIREARRPVDDVMAADCDAGDVVRARLAFWAVLAREEDRAVGLDVAAGPLPVRVAAADLGAALDALLGNVFAHTPAGTSMWVTVRRGQAGSGSDGRGSGGGPGSGPARGGGVEVEVADDGPGLPSPEVVTRGRSGAGSTGLGLSIVRRTAEQAGGTVTVGRSDGGGVRVVVQLGAP